MKLGPLEENLPHDEPLTGVITPTSTEHSPDAEGALQREEARKAHVDAAVCPLREGLPQQEVLLKGIVAQALHAPPWRMLAPNRNIGHGVNTPRAKCLISNSEQVRNVKTKTRHCT